MVFLLVLGYWLLPREGQKRTELSEVLLQYLAMASDIMELYALFDDDGVLTDTGLTYGILAVWSISFIQFVIVPDVLKTSTEEESEVKSVWKELREPLTAFFLQDAPFLSLRISVMARLNLITHSLVFFQLKNILAIIIQLYKISLMLYTYYSEDGRDLFACIRNIRT